MRFLITAGGTREYIDPVRFISNASSGKMGYALARAALARAHQVRLITAPVTLRPPAGAVLESAVSANDMYDSVKTYFPQCDCLIMCAAVSDYTVAHPSKTKIKKIQQEMTLRLKPTRDILKWAGQHKCKPSAKLVIGFALEDQDHDQNAEKKLRDKHLDMIIANTPSAIGADASALSVKTPHGDWIHLAPTMKRTNAKRIIRLIEELAHPNRSAGRL
jgi:phosphopantothenoylcysteine decarboxylase / phosphopantothenate---cysteine ligase